MTITPTRLRAEDDTRRAPTGPGRLLTPAHKVTSCGEFTRRSDVLHAYAVSGRQLLQAVGAWQQLWVAHSRSDGTVWLTAEQTAAALGISRPLWAELAGLLAAGGLLVPHGQRYAVPDAAALEGLGRHLAPGGWRSLHRDTYRASVLGRLEVDGAQRLAVQGVLAWVLLRHTAVRGTGVARAAKPELAGLLDPRTLRRYLQLLAGVLDCPSRGRLAYVGRTALERPETGAGPSLLPSLPEPPRRPADPHPAPPDDQECTFTGAQPGFGVTRNARSGASPRSGTSTGQDLPAGGAATRRPPVLPAWGSRDGSEHRALPELVARLEDRAPGAWEVQARPDVRKILSAALWTTEGDVDALADALCADPFTGARSIVGVLRSRAAVATERIRRRQAALDRQARAQRWEQWERERLATERAARTQAAATAAAEQDRSEQDRQRLRDVAGADYDQHLDLAGTALLGRIRSRAATERAVLTAVRDRLAADALTDVAADAVRTALDQVLDELFTRCRRDTSPRAGATRRADQVDPCRFTATITEQDMQTVTESLDPRSRPRPPLRGCPSAGSGNVGASA
jgi:uncharacterized protein YjeT (DUF2065 family)